jgi:hypothetical protein
MEYTSKKDIISLIVKQILEEHNSLFGTKTTPLLNSQILNHRPYSIIARLSFSWNKSEKSVYVKIPLNGDILNIQKEFRVLSYYKELFKNYCNFSVVKPLAFYNEPPALITEECSGEAFDIIVRHNGRLFPSDKTMRYLSLLCKNCGEWLRIFQSFSPIKEDQSFKFEDTVGFIHNQLNRCSENILLEQDIINKIHKYIDDKASTISIPNIIITGMHSDFILSNILIDGEKVRVLDFGGYREGPACRDVATFLYSLEILLVNPMFRFSTIDLLKKEFLLGYGWGNNQKDLQLFKLFYIRELLGGLIELSKRMQRGYLRLWILKRIQKRSKKLLLDIIDN